MSKSVLSIVLNSFQHDSRVLMECQSLQRAGYQVQVAALHSGDLPEREVIGGIPVHRIQLKSKRWSKNRIIQLFKWVEWFYRLVREYRKTDIFHCNDTAPLPAGVLIKWLFNWRAKVVYDAHELEFDKVEPHSNYYPQAMLALNERLFIRHANARMTVSPLIAKAYVERYGIAPPAVVMNCPPYRDPAERQDLFREKFGIRPEQKIFLYQGGLIVSRGVELLLEIFEDMPEAYVLVVLGFGPLTPLVQEAAANNPQIYYHPAVSPVELDAYTRSADYGFCFYQGHSGNHQLTIGNKIFQYQMAGLPVLASDLKGLRYVLQDGTGLVVEDFRDKAQLKAAMLEIATWKRSDYLPKLQAAAKRHNWEAQEEVLLNLYKQLYVKG